MVGVRTVVKDEVATPAPYTVLVAVANPDNVAELVSSAAALAAQHDGELLVVSVIHKPVTSPFLLFADGHIHSEFDDGFPAVLEHAQQVATDLPVTVRRHLLVASDVSAAIITAAHDADADALLIGWQDRSRPSDIVLGATVDRVMAQTPIDTFVQRVGTSPSEVESILIPTVGGPHLEPATKIAGALATANNATVSVISFIPSMQDTPAVETAWSHVETATELLPDVSTEHTVEAANDIQTAIVTAAADHAYVILGATREWRVRQPVVGALAQTIGETVDTPVIIARRGRSQSPLDRLLNRFPA